VVVPVALTLFKEFELDPILKR